VDRDNSARVGCDGEFQLGRVDTVVVGFYIYEHGGETVMEHDVDGGYEGNGRYNDFLSILPPVEFF
jgi:hypothetical protein